MPLKRVPETAEWRQQTFFADQRMTFSAALEKAIQPSDWVLIKGSRGMRMETLVQALQAQYGRMEASA